MVKSWFTSCMFARVFALTAIYFLGGCGTSYPDQTVSADPWSSADLQVDSASFSDVSLIGASIGRALNSVQLETAGSNPDLLAALADCQCKDDGFATRYLARVVTRGGALPQLLMPMVREGVAKSPQVQLLLSMPASYRSVIDAMLGVDSLVKNQIKSTVAGKISSSLPGGSTVADRYDFRFDGFAPASGNPEDSRQAFSVGDQAVRWNYILGKDALWESGRPIDGVDHGLQLLNSALVLAEWSYLFGLEKASNDGRIYGGLTISAKTSSPGNLSDSGLAAFDPRISKGPSRFVSGPYAVSFPAGDAIAMATEVKETWQRTAATVTLDEQSRIWRAGARALERLRPAARQTTSGLFAGSNGIFPADAHTAAMLFLPGMEALLNGPFVSAETQSIRLIADFAVRADGSPDPAGFPSSKDTKKLDPARLLSLARMASALSRWAGALADTSDLNVDAATRARLDAAHLKLKDPARLALVLLAREMPRDLGGMIEVEREIGRTPLSPGVAAEILFHVAFTANHAMDSEFLRERALAMMDRFAARYLRPIWRDQARQAALDAAGVIWIHNALAEYLRMDGPGLDMAERYPWMQSARDVFSAAITNWSDGIL
jgi:hypothetical protein